MTDKQQITILQKFADDHSITLGGKLKVYLTQFTTQFKPLDNTSPAKCEDVVYLSDVLKGAEQFCYWLRRNGYEIKRGKKCE